MALIMPIGSSCGDSEYGYSSETWCAGRRNRTATLGGEDCGQIAPRSLVFGPSSKEFDLAWGR